MIKLQSVLAIPAPFIPICSYSLDQPSLDLSHPSSSHLSAIFGLSRQFGNTPLITASQLGNRSVCKVLLDHGADVNAKTLITGRTALHVAVIGGHAATIVGLIKRGADLCALDKAGITAIDLIPDNVRSKILRAYCEASAAALLIAFPLLSYKQQREEWKNLLPLLSSEDKKVAIAAATSFGKLDATFRQAYEKEFIAAIRLQSTEFVSAFSEAAFFREVGIGNQDGNAHVLGTELETEKSASQPMFNINIARQADSLEQEPERSQSRVLMFSRVTGSDDSKSVQNSPMKRLSHPDYADDEDALDAHQTSSSIDAPVLSAAFKRLSGGDQMVLSPTPLDQPSIHNISTSLGEAVTSFVPMEARDVLVWFDRITVDNQKIMSKLRDGIATKLQSEEAAKIVVDKPEAIAKAFVQIQIELAKKHQDYLLAVIRIQRLRLANLWVGTWQGISQESHFNDYTELTFKSSEAAAEMHGKDPRQLEGNIEELTKQARAIQSRHRKFMKTLAAACRGTAISAALKSEGRIMTEAGLAPGDEQWGYRKILDLVRGGVECPSMNELKWLLEFMLACSAVGTHSTENAVALGKGREAIVIMEITDRMGAPSSHGQWPLTEVHFYFADDVNKHVCEVQLVHSAIQRLREQHGANLVYKQVRTASELMGATGTSVLSSGYACPANAEHALVSSGPQHRMADPDTRLLYRMAQAEAHLVENRSMSLAARDFATDRIQEFDNAVQTKLDGTTKTLLEMSDELQRRTVSVTQEMTTKQTDLEKRTQTSNAKLVKQVAQSLDGAVEVLEETVKQQTITNALLAAELSAKQVTLEMRVNEKLQRSLDSMEANVAKVTMEGREMRDGMQTDHLELEVRVANAVGTLVKMQQTQIAEQRCLIAGQQTQLDQQQQQLVKQGVELAKLQTDCSKITELEAATARQQTQLKKLEPLLWFAPHLEALLNGAAIAGLDNLAKQADQGQDPRFYSVDAESLLMGTSPPRSKTDSTATDGPAATSAPVPQPADNNTVAICAAVAVGEKDKAGSAFSTTLAGICNETPEKTPPPHPMTQGGQEGALLLASMGKALAAAAGTKTTKGTTIIQRNLNEDFAGTVDV
jgi:hypothetical protein